MDGRTELCSGVGAQYSQGAALHTAGGGLYGRQTPVRARLPGIQGGTPRGVLTDRVVDRVRGGPAVLGQTHEPGMLPAGRPHGCEQPAGAVPWWGPQVGVDEGGDAFGQQGTYRPGHGLTLVLTVSLLQPAHGLGGVRFLQPAVGVGYGTSVQGVHDRERIGDMGGIERSVAHPHIVEVSGRGVNTQVPYPKSPQCRSKDRFGACVEGGKAPGPAAGAAAGPGAGGGGGAQRTGRMDQESELPMASPL